MNAKTTHRTFSRETEVAIDIRTTPETVWSLLTDAAAYPTWNSTVLSIEGEIAPGRKENAPGRSLSNRKAPAMVISRDRIPAKAIQVASRVASP